MQGVDSLFLTTAQCSYIASTTAKLIWQTPHFLLLNLEALPLRLSERNLAVVGTSTCTGIELRYRTDERTEIQPINLRSCSRRKSSASCQLYSQGTVNFFEEIEV